MLNWLDMTTKGKICRESETEYIFALLLPHWDCNKAESKHGEYGTLVVVADSLLFSHLL